ILATTRADPRLYMHFSDARRLDLIADAPPEADDIQAYALNRLAQVVGGDTGALTSLAGRIAAAASGDFLYATLALDELSLRLTQNPALDMNILKFPYGLSDFLHAFLDRVLGRDKERWYESIRPVLGLLAVAQGNGLTRTQLKRISGKEVELPLRIC